MRKSLFAVVEALLIFSGAVLVFRALSLSPLHQKVTSLLGGQDYFFVEYAGVALLVIGALTVSGRDLAGYGLTLQRPKYLFTFTARALLPFLLLGAVLSFVNWRQWPGTLVVSLAAFGALILTALATKKTLPLGQALGMGMMVLFSPATLASPAQAPASILVRTLYVYLLVGPAEELLFRGYIQSRLNTVLGQPLRFWGARWGWGAILSALLFGLWHVTLMPGTPGVWLQAVWTACAGLAFGYVREKSGSLAPASFLHSLINYLPFSDLLAA